MDIYAYENNITLRQANKELAFVSEKDFDKFVTPEDMAYKHTLVLPRLLKNLISSVFSQRNFYGPSHEITNKIINTFLIKPFVIIKNRQNPLY